jgi:hypothetical protein
MTLRPVVTLLCCAFLTDTAADIMHDIRGEKWAVVTSIFPPSEAISVLAALPGWHVVVVGDKKSPPSHEWSDLPQNVVFLDVDTQARLGYRIIKHLPWDSYSRKVCGSGCVCRPGCPNPGACGCPEYRLSICDSTWGANPLRYRFATLQMSTQVVTQSFRDEPLATDDDNILNATKISAVNDDESLDAWYIPDTHCVSVWLQLPSDATDVDSCPVVNQLGYFGEPLIWPRGLPLECVQHARSTTTASTPCEPARNRSVDVAPQAASVTFPTKSESSASVQQLLAQYDPDTGTVTHVFLILWRGS